MLAKIVAKKKDGDMIKGSTGDFVSHRNTFHVTIDGEPDTCQPVLVNDLKAVFFVKSLKGSKAPHNRPPEKTSRGAQYTEKQIRVVFADNEVIEGYTHGLHMDRLGFFMTPLDPNDNNDRIFVVLSSVKSLYSDGKEVAINSEAKSVQTCELCGKKLDLSWKFCPFDGTRIK